MKDHFEASLHLHVEPPKNHLKPRIVHQIRHVQTCNLFFKHFFLKAVAAKKEALQVVQAQGSLTCDG